MPNPVRSIVRFTGNVQGVGFRATAKQEAFGLDLNGTVRNEADGSVRIDVDGPREDAEVLVDRLKQQMGPKIDNVQLTRQDSLGRSDGFRIEH